MAAQAGNLKQVIHFLSQPHTDVDERIQNRATALILACGSGHLDVARVLLDHKADVNAHTLASLSAHRYTPLSAAAEGGHTRIVELLLKHRANPRKGRNPSCDAAKNGHIHTLELLLSHYPALAHPHAKVIDVNEDDYEQPAEIDKQEWPLYLAVSQGHLDVCQTLIRHKADVFGSCGEQPSLVSEARTRGDTKMMAFLATVCCFVVLLVVLTRFCLCAAINCVGGRRWRSSACA